MLAEKTRVECFMVCDGAQECGGKLYVLGGGWNEIRGKSFPLAYRDLALAIRLSVPWNETNKPHAFEIKLLSDDGDEVLPKPLKGDFNVGRPPTVEPGDDLPVLLAITMSGVVLLSPGGYSFRLLIDGEESAMTRVRARKVG